ncbi:MAG: ribbon-helix-helix protein, CopG family [Vicinamibacterales bacterium]
MPFSFRLDKETAARIRRLAAATGRTKSDVVREAVARYAPEDRSRHEAGASALDRLRAYVGVVTTDGAQYSQKTHAKFRAALEQKHRTRRSR